jgi:hypothetical protein
MFASFVSVDTVVGGVAAVGFVAVVGVVGVVIFAVLAGRALILPAV